MEARKVLYFNPAAAQDEQLEVLRSLGWDAYEAHALDEVERLKDTHRFYIGLASLAAPRETVMPAINGLFGPGDPMEWIALLRPEDLQRPDVCQVIARYFYDYHTLPADPPRLQCTLGHAYGMAGIMRLCRFHKERADAEEMVGSSPPIMQLLRDIGKIAPVDAPVLICGESGTGKELTALAIHRRGSRADKPFVAVNCGALPATLIQSELFGYEKGAFSGADQRKTGRIEAAAGGTIFLDEIGDLPLDMQVNLLRFFQEKTIQRVGGTREIQVDVRIIAATHVDLETAVREGRFREDLYYRLNVLKLKVPPLRERREDIEILAKYYFDRFSSEKSRRVKGFAPETMEAMRLHGWPGNVRELVNRIRRAMVMCEGQLITPADMELSSLPAHSASSCNSISALDLVKAKAEKDAILTALKLTENNISSTARRLGIARATLYRLMDKHRINHQEMHSSFLRNGHTGDCGRI